MAVSTTVMVSAMESFALVLTTVNAPHSKQLDGAALGRCIMDAALARTHPGHMSSFFGEVPAEAQKAFAKYHGISEGALVSAAKAFAAYSGETCYPLAA